MFSAKLGLSEFHESSAEKIQLENMFFLARPGLSEFHKISVQKKNVFFSKPSFSEFRESSPEKNIFLEPEKLFFRSCNPC